LASAADFRVTDGRGTAALDFDRDGDVDIAVANANGRYEVYENLAEHRRSIQIDLQGPTVRGTCVYVTEGGRTQLGVLDGQTDYLSQDARILHFGTGNATWVDVRVVWPDGTERRFADVRTGRRLVIDRSGIADARRLTSNAGEADD
jgi:hypothetical protein